MIFAEESAPDLFQQLLALLAAIIMPVWNDLIGLIPMVLIGLLIAYFLFTLWQWRANSARNKPRLIPRYAGTAPPGVHLPGPSKWVAVAPVAMACFLAGLIFGPLWFAVGIILGLISAAGLLADAMGEWQQAESGVHGPLATGTSSAVALAPGSGALTGSAGSGSLVAAGGMTVVAESEPPEPPPGVHMPGPSPWPFFAPIGLMVIFYGVIFSPALIVGGIVMGIIAAVGWLLDSNYEYRTTEAVGHAVPKTRDPRAVWPRRLVPIYGLVLALSLFVAGLPAIGQFIAGLAPAAPDESAVAVPAQPEISASSAVSFDTNKLVVPAGRAFNLVFHNNNDGVPHNVEIADGPDKTTILFSGEKITGVADVTYQVNNLQAGNYYFFCVVHPNMNGTVEAVPESGPGGVPEGPPLPAPTSSASTP